MLRYGLVVFIALLLSGCEMFGKQDIRLPIDVVSLQYDPYNYSMAELSRNATAACIAKGGTEAVAVDNEINTESVRWAYMNFNCYR